MSADCGHGPEAFDTEADGAYEVEIVRCHHCAAVERARAKFVAAGGDPSGVIFRVTRRPVAPAPVVVKVDAEEVWKGLLTLKKRNGGTGLGLA